MTEQVNGTGDQATPTSQAQVRRADSDDVDVLGLLIVFAKHKKLVLGLPAVVAVLAAVISLLMPNIYTATARLLPPQQGQSAAAAILGQLASLGSAATAVPGLKNPSDLYIGMLKSRTIADRLIERFGLIEIYEKDTLVETRQALAEATDITSGKDGIIAIEVDDELPERSAAIANAYVEELERMNESLALTEASQRRLFFEKQLRQTKEALALSEVELKKTQEKTGLIKLDEQGRAIIEAVAQFRAQVAAKEVQLAAMKSFATENNPDLIRAEQELIGLRNQLRKLEGDKSSGQGDILVPTGRVPQAGLEYVRKYRDVKYHETLFELVAKQYELARLDEAKEASLIQVVDKAVAPDRKSKPRRALIVILSGVVAAMLAILLALLRESLESARGDPADAKRLELLRRYLGRKPA